MDAGNMKENYKKTNGTNMRSYAWLLVVFLCFKVDAQQKLLTVAEIQSAFVNNAIQLQELRSLLYNVNSSVYIVDDEIKTYGTAPKIVYAHLKSISRVNDIKSGLDTVQLLQIDLTKEQILGKIEDSVFGKLPNLKYIYYLVTSDQQNELLSKVSTSNYTTFYEVITRR